MEYLESVQMIVEKIIRISYINHYQRRRKKNEMQGTSSRGFNPYK